MAFSLLYPFKTTQPITQNYGNGHVGIDYGCATGTKVYAGCNGIVTVKEITSGGSSGNGLYKSSDGKPLRSYGRVIYLDNGSYRVFYGHLNSFNVSNGAKVKKGDLIGYSGNTGNSTGPHLHLELRKNDVILNPNNYLKTGGPYIDTPNTSTSDNIPEEVYVTYNKWSGQGKIKNNYTDLLWFDDKGKAIKSGKIWSGFYGMKDNIFQFIGKTTDNKYYYGYNKGACHSQILCVVPIDKIKNINGKASGGTGKIIVGRTYNNSSS